MRKRSSTRRGFLTVTGATLLAGCSGLDQFSDDSDEMISSHRLPDVVKNGESEPIVVDTVPVNIERDRLTETVQRVSTLLGTLPIPFGPEDIPNGYVRRQLVNAANDASAHIEDARTASNRLQAFQSLRQARENARYAATGWAFVESNLTEETVQAEYQQAVSKAQSFQADHKYIGRDPITAALVHARIERNLDNALTEQSPPSYRNSGPLLTVAEWGEQAESTAALVADSRYLYDRFTSSLPTAAGTVEATLRTAVETVLSDLRNRREELPAEPTEDNRELVWRLRYRLHDAAESSIDHISQTNSPASALLTATAGLMNFLAYDRLRKRIDDGEEFSVEDASAVREHRSQALEAIRTALEQSPRPALTRSLLADEATTIAFADEELSRYRGDVRLAQLSDPVRRYIGATMRARSVPTANQQMLDALEG